MIWQGTVAYGPKRGVRGGVAAILIARIGMSSPSDKSAKVRAEGEQLRLDFIRTDLNLCLTFAAVAETSYSMGHREQAERAIASAEKGYTDLLWFFSQAKQVTPETRNELQLTFKRLRERLDGLQRLGKG